MAVALPPWDPSATADVAVVGCGPAGLALAAQLARLGLRVALVGRDAPFVNNYGVWLDEFKDLGLEDTLEASEWRGWLKGCGGTCACSSSGGRAGKVGLHIWSGVGLVGGCLQQGWLATQKAVAWAQLTAKPFDGLIG